MPNNSGMDKLNVPTSGAPTPMAPVLDIKKQDVSEDIVSAPALSSKIS